MAASAWKLQIGAAVASMLLVSLLVVRVSSAAFSATTQNPANNWASGSIALSDDDGGGVGSAMFDVTGMLPGQTATRCIKLTYTGATNPTAVKLYGSVTDGGLADHLEVTVKEGTGGGYGSCSGFTASGTILNAVKLKTFGSTRTDYSTGAGTWDPAATGEAKVYEFTVTLRSDTPSSAQGSDAKATFTWETTT